jgi:ornithine carbamoyltransferase
MHGKDFLSIRDFSPSEIQYLLVLARQVKSDPTAYSASLRRETLAMIFEKTFFTHASHV